MIITITEHVARCDGRLATICCAGGHQCPEARRASSHDRLLADLEAARWRIIRDDDDELVAVLCPTHREPPSSQP
jgi:hypothetical protein